MERSTIGADSGSPYENRDYVQSEMRDALKRNVKRQTAAISPQDLHESFVESPDWYDDLDDNTKIRFGRGLKAVEEAPIPRTNDTSELADKSANSEPRDLLRTSCNISYTSHNRYRNATADSTNVLNTHRDVSNLDIQKTEETIPIRTTEQKSANHQTPRIRREASSYRAFYDDLDGSPVDRLRLSDVLEDQSDDFPHWHDDVVNRYSTRLRSVDSRKQEKTGKASNNNKSQLSANILDRHAKKGRSHSSWNNRRNKGHPVHRSDMSKNGNRGDWKPKINKRRRQKESRVGMSRSSGRGSSQKSRIADQQSLRAGLNEALGEKVLYENAEDQSVSVEKQKVRGAGG